MMRSNRLLRLLALLLIGALLGLTGCGTSKAPTNKQPEPTTTTPTPNAPAAQGDYILRIALNADPPKLDPHQSTALVDRQVFQSLFDRLVDLDKDLNITPMLAEKWTVSDDGKSYTFNLRKDVKFHDGTDFNAEAVKYNFDRMFDPAMNSPRKGEISMLDKVTVVDPSTVKVDLKVPFAGFLYALTDRAGMIVSPEAAKKAGLDLLNNPVGTGPFKFKERVKGDSITLVRNDKYWKKGLPLAAGVVYKTVIDENVKLVNLQSGQLDIIDTVPAKQVPQLKTDNRVQLSLGPSLQHQGVWINTTKAPLNNKLVRQALDAAIDRKALVQVVFGETALPAVGPFAPNTPANDGAAIPTKDLAKAKKLLADAGLANGFSTTLKVAPSPVNQQIGQVLQSMWAEAGIKVEIQQEEFGQLLEKFTNGNYDLGQLGWSGRPDPDGNIYNFVKTGASNNYAKFSNATVDKLLDDARVPTDMAKRKAIYTDLMKVVREETPYLYLWHPLDVKALGPTVKGFVAYPDGMIRTVSVSK